MSVTYTLSDGSTTVTLYPGWDFDHRKTMDRSDHRSITQKLTSFKWHSFNAFKFKVHMLAAADASTINAWFDAGTTLTFTITRDGTASAYTVKIVNKSTPFPKQSFPRVDYYEGELELEATTHT